MTYEAAQNRIDNPEDTSSIAARLVTSQPVVLCPNIIK